jgi:hypothetical protein
MTAAFIRMRTIFILSAIEHSMRASLLKNPPNQDWWRMYANPTSMVLSATAILGYFVLAGGEDGNTWAGSLTPGICVAALLLFRLKKHYPVIFATAQAMFAIGGALFNVYYTPLRASSTARALLLIACVVVFEKSLETLDGIYEKERRNVVASRQ